MQQNARIIHRQTITCSSVTLFGFDPFPKLFEFRIEWRNLIDER
jgi:hypothetical protein